MDRLIDRVTCEAAVEVRVGGHLQAGVRQQVAADVGEAGVDVFPDVLQLLVLVLLHLDKDVNVSARTFGPATNASVSRSDSRAAVSPGSFVLPPDRTDVRRGNSSLGSGTSDSEEDSRISFK